MLYERKEKRLVEGYTDTDTPFVTIAAVKDTHFYSTTSAPAAASAASSSSSSSAPRTIAVRIVELNERLCNRAEQPLRQVCDVDANGACFFLALRHGLVEVKAAHAPLTSDSVDQSSDCMRLNVVAKMRAMLESPQGALMREFLELAEFHGADGSADTYLAHMSKPTTEVDEPVIMCSQIVYRVRIKLEYNVGTGGAKYWQPQPFWGITDAEWQEWPTVFLGALVDILENGQRSSNGHFVYLAKVAAVAPPASAASSTSASTFASASAAAPSAPPPTCMAAKDAAEEALCTAVSRDGRLLHDPAAAHMSASTSAAAAASGGEGMPLSDGVPGGAQSKSARISPDVPSTQLSRERLFHNGPHPKRASRSTAVVDLVDVKPHEPPSKRKPQSATPLLRFGHHFQEDKSAKMMLGLTSTSDFDAFPLVLGHSFDRGSFFSVEMAQKFDNDATPTSLVLLPDCAVALQSVCRSSLIY